jgi:hypothetical protein
MGDLMKISYINDGMLIYLNQYLIGNVNLENKEELEKYLKKLFKKLKNNFDITINGFYDIEVFIDKYYGTILKLVREDISYFDYYDNHVDMKLTYQHVSFLYKVDNIELINKCTQYYLYKKDLYIELKNNLSNKDMLRLIENSSIIYEDTDNIINKAKKINISGIKV